MTYDAMDRLRTLSPDASCSYSLEYNDYNDPSRFCLNGSIMLEKTFNYDSNTVTTAYYKDNQTKFPELTTTFDKYGKPTVTTENGKYTMYTYQNIEESPSLARVESMYDPYAGKEYTYKYNDEGNPVKYSSAGSSIEQTAYNITRYTIDGDAVYEAVINYDEINTINPRILSTTISDNDWTSEYGYDKLGRLETVNTETANKFDTNRLINTYVYNSGTSLIAKDEFKISDNYSLTTHYQYDNNGNPKTVINEDSDTVYVYDAMNRLDAETNRKTNVTTSYKYDSAGRLSTVTSPAGIRNYNYEKGRLISYTGSGNFAYDNAGHPVMYNGHTADWTGGGLLMSYKDISYSYNASGVRLKSESSIGLSKSYHLDGGRILGEDWSDGTNIRYYYNLTGIAGFKHSYRGISNYYNYVKDIFGSIIAIYAGNTCVAKYSYNALGKCECTYSSNLLISLSNPFRWRGHYYDTETGFLMMYINGKTRYYDPSIGQFISPDYDCLDPLAIGGLNPYSLESAFGVSNPLQVPPNHANIYSSIDSANGIGVFNGTGSGIVENSLPQIDTRGLNIFGQVVGGAEQLALGASQLFSGLAAGFAQTANATHFIIDGYRIANSFGGMSQGYAELATNTARLSNNISKAAKIAKGIGIGLFVLDIGLTIYNNYSNPNLSSRQKGLYTLSDVGFSSVVFALGMFGGPIGFGVGLLIWVGYEFLGLKELIRKWID